MITTTLAFPKIGHNLTISLNDVSLALNRRVGTHIRQRSQDISVNVERR